MKTATHEVQCDACGKVIPLVLSGSLALQLSLRGQSVGHRKADFCDWQCLARWAAREAGTSQPTGDETLWEKTVDDLLLWQVAHEDMGIYPRAVVEGGVERKRTEWQDGWNAALIGLSEKQVALCRMWAALPVQQRRMLREMLPTEAIWLRPALSGIEMCVNCNDSFAWGTADAEDVTADELPTVYAAWKAHGDSGILAWVERKRGEKAYEFGGAEKYKDNPDLVAARAFLAALGVPQEQKKP